MVFNSVMKNQFRFPALAAIIIFCSSISFSQPVRYSENIGHSHNDYNQDIPFLFAYYAGMGSIEADVYLRNGTLLVAHDAKDIRADRTLDKLYFSVIAEMFRRNGGNIREDSTKKLQLLIDIKENYSDVIPAIVLLSNRYPGVFDFTKNPRAVHIVLTGNIPPPEKFSDYPAFLSYDGRPGIEYTKEQLSHIALISADVKTLSNWNGKGTPVTEDAAKLKQAIDHAHALGKPFRFWDTKDNVNTWIELEKLGVDWIGTDHPGQLQEFYAHKAKQEYTNSKPYSVYTPTYKNDGGTGKVKNVILLIGDGMGLAQIQAALTANYGNLNLAMFRFIGLSRTEAADSDFTDSAAGGTAFACGEKTNNRFIAMDTLKRPILSLADKLAKYKMKTGIISSGDITDATPAVFYAHQPDRSMSYEIASDLASSHVDILVGPNRKSFTENPDKQLMQKLADKGYKLSTTLKAFNAVSGNGKQLVLLDDSVCRPVKNGRGDMLVSSFRKTLELLSANKEGFFIMAEGAQIDYGGHSNNLPYVVTELHDFDKMVGEALRFADKNGETLVVVTADHETGGLTFQDAQYRKGMIRGSFSTDDHTNIMVPVFAYGPGSSAFRGIFPNTATHFKILNALHRQSAGL